MALPPSAPEELLARFATGDEGAFEQLCAEWGGRVFAFIARFLGDLHLAEDVYQEALTKVAMHAASQGGQPGAAAWIFQIARNSCLDAIRLRKRRSHISLDKPVGTNGAEDGTTLADSLPGKAEDPDAKLARAELAEALNNALAKLPDEQREVFLLKEEGGLSFDEIGNMVGCGRETVKSRMRYALERLRNSLRPEAKIHELR